MYLQGKTPQDLEFRLKIYLGNEAFSEDPRPELARLLNQLAVKVLESDLYSLKNYQSIRDINGNSVGQYAIKPIGV
jgi:DNA replication protein DnaD